MEYRDYYATLGVAKDASQADIRKAFRRLAREHHPDVNKGDAAAEKRFKEISEAHEVLADPEKRKAYDQLGANWAAYQQAGAARGAGNPFAGFRGAAASGFPGAGGVRFEFHGDPEDLEGFSDFFRTFFAGGAAGARTTGGVDMDPLFGGIGGDGGAGYASSGFGTGSPRGTRRTWQVPPQRPPDATADASLTLEEVLSGTERHLEVGHRRLEVRIPPGVSDGQRIRLSGKAEGGGDIYINVHVLPHLVFTRAGANLTRELPLTLAEALLGGEVKVGSLSGRELLLKIPPGTQTGRLFRLSGQGLPRFRKEGRGDLLVRTRVVLPTGLDEEARERARELLDHIDQPDPRRTTITP